MRSSTGNLTSIDKETFSFNSSTVVVTRTQKASGSLTGTFDLKLSINGSFLIAKGNYDFANAQVKMKICNVLSPVKITHPHPHLNLKSH